MATQMQLLEGMFHALADATRLRILGLLLSGEVCVCDLHESLGAAQPKISRHLAYLRRAGLVATRREGLWVHYRLAQAADPVLATILQAVTHALGHVDAVRRDTRALEKTTGCVLPPQACQPCFDCCAPRRPAGRP
jgi:ArsR family transcriptional regulator, arsenate/arsenite/antimonite-responsive transcriptional repressor